MGVGGQKAGVQRVITLWRGAWGGVSPSNEKARILSRIAGHIERVGKFQAVAVSFRSAGVSSCLTPRMKSAAFCAWAAA